MWYRFTPAVETVLVADTFGSDYDTVLAAHTGTTMGDLTAVACSENAKGSQSRVAIRASAGVTYYLQVGGSRGQWGDLVFHLGTPAGPLPNDHFAAAHPISSLPFSDSLDTTDASDEPGEPRPCSPIGSSVWYRFTPAADTVLVADTLGSDYDTVLAAYTGTSLSPLTEVACNDNFGGTSKSRITIPASAGVTYRLQVGGASGDWGNLVFQVRTGALPPNDHFADAHEVPTLPFSGTLDTAGASDEPEEPRPCNLIGSTVWYRVTTQADTVLVADTLGSDYDTVLAAYTGTSLSELTEVACNDDFGVETDQSRIAIRAPAGVTYYLQAGGFHGNTGNLVFRVHAPALPPNDHFANAYEITSLPFTDSLDTVQASDQPEEPHPCTSDIRSTVWYRFTPPADLALVADTFGSNFDTVLAAYTGTSLSGLTALACNNNFVDETLQSRIAIRVSAGVTYYFQVGTFSRETGNVAFELSVAPPLLTGPGTATRVSVAADGAEGDGASSRPAMSADGRYVAFASYATNLVSGDTNRSDDVFVRDRDPDGDGTFDEPGEVSTTRASVAGDGTQGDNDSRNPVISADGRYVAFESFATNLVSGGDLNGWPADVFVHDRETGTTTRVSISSAGVQGDNWSRSPAISADGRHVAFESYAANLVVGDVNRRRDVFVHDRDARTTTRVSVASDGGDGDEESSSPDISTDGRHVAFESRASNLVNGDTNASYDVFIHDRDADADGTFDELRAVATTRISLSSSGVQGNESSASPAVSADGRHVAFASRASNLVNGDTNASYDVFIHDRDPDGDGTFYEPGAITTTRVSVASDGTESDDHSFSPAISANGRHVALESSATNLVPGDFNDLDDVFVHDRVNKTTAIMSFDAERSWANGASSGPALNSQGRFVAFDSHASDLVRGDTNQASDVFVRNLREHPAEGRPVEIAIGDVKITEGDSGSRTAHFPVTLSRPSAGAVSVNYTPGSLSAARPDDYAAKSGTLTIPAGALSGFVPVAVKGDEVDEAHEQLRVRLSVPTGATIADSVGVATIVDDDLSTGLRLTVSDVTVDEGDAKARTVRLTVSLSAAAASTVTVNYATLDVTATAPGDYVAKNGTVSFSPGTTSRFISLPVKADTAMEAAERFQVKLSGATGGATISDRTGVVTIRNDD